MFHGWFKLAVSVPGQCEASRHQRLRHSALANICEAHAVFVFAGVWSRRYSVASIGQRGFQSGDAGCAGNGGTPAIVGRARLDRAPRVRVRPRAEAAYSWPVEVRCLFKLLYVASRPRALASAMSKAGGERRCCTRHGRAARCGRPSRTRCLFQHNAQRADTLSAPQRAG